MSEPIKNLGLHEEPEELPERSIALVVNEDGSFYLLIPRFIQELKGEDEVPHYVLALTELESILRERGVESLAGSFEARVERELRDDA